MWESLSESSAELLHVNHHEAATSRLMLCRHGLFHTHPGLELGGLLEDACG